MNRNPDSKLNRIGKAVLCAAVLLAAFFGAKKGMQLYLEQSIGTDRPAWAQGITLQSDGDSPKITERAESTGDTADTAAGEIIVSSEREKPVEIAGAGTTAKLENIPGIESKYLLANLSEDLKKDFAELYRVTAGFENFCYLPIPVSKEDTGVLMTLLHTECPELFQNDSSQEYHMEMVGDLVLSVTVPYSMSKTQYDEELAQCRKAVEEIRKKAAAGENDYEKALTVYREICSRSAYEREDPRSGDAAGVLLKGIGKCDGFSLAFKWVMDELGIPCIVVAGNSRESDREGHAWNLVKTDGVWCTVDVTQDCDTVNRSILCYPVFNTSDAMLMKDYSFQPGFESLKVPSCDTVEQSYHVRNGSYIRGGEEKEGFFRALEQAGTEGGKAPAQFETEEGWKTFLENSGDWAKEWMERNGLFGTSSYYSIDAFRTVEISVSINENSERMQEISDVLSVYEGKIEAAKEELSSRKAALDVQFAEIERIRTEAEELLKDAPEELPDEVYEAYNGLVDRYNELQDSYRQAAELYNQLVTEYQELCDSYNVLVKEFNALAGKL